MLKILTVTGASTEEEPAESEGQHDTGDWHQWSSQHKPWSRGNFDTVWAPVKKNESESPWSDPAPCITNSHINLTTPSSCFHLENESLHPQSGAGLTPSTLGFRGLFGRMWTQHPVSYTREWPRTYWILGAEPGALDQSGRLRLSHTGLELRHL